MTPSNPSSTHPPCDLCGGQQIGNWKLIGQHRVGIHPRDRWLWARPQATLDAFVCLGCGHTKLFVADLEEVREEAQRDPGQFTW